MTQENLRELFLRKFMNELINNVEVERFPIPETKNKILADEKVVQKIESEIKISPPTNFTPIKITKFTAVDKKLLQKRSPVNKFVKSQKKSILLPLTSPTEGYPELGKLNTLVSDAGVEGVECLGPDKNILVKKGGRVQRTSVILTKEEIKKILRDFSQKTRIPLTKGTFKAALGNLILTAILSEFVGTKFILQKKNPVIFQNPL